MPSAFSRLRVWFGISALLTVAVVAGFYGYARYRVRKALHDLPAKLGANIQQNTEGFTYSQSAGGRTVFAITASNAVRYKEGDKAELHNVKIISYGRGADRLDQISGDDFEYDAKSGDITAKGKVAIDLQAAVPGTSRPGGNVKTTGSPVHLDAVGLIFNKNTGVAQTSGTVTFQLPQASGSMVGAIFDSKQNTFDLRSDVRLRTAGPNPMDLRAANAVFEDDNQELRLNDLQAESGIRRVEARHTVLHLRADNTVERADATDGITAHISGARPAQLYAATANFVLGPKNQLASGRLNGDVAWETGGASASRGRAGQVLLNFGPDNELKTARLRDGVDLTQIAMGGAASGSTMSANTPPQNGSSPGGNEFRGDGLDLQLTAGSRLQQARSVGKAEIILAGSQTASKSASPPVDGKTVITSSLFEAKFSSNNQVSGLTGSAPIKIVSSRQGQPDRVSQSNDLLATFGNDKAATLQQVVQSGNVQIQEGERNAIAERATYNQASDAMTLTGNVRYRDPLGGSSLTSNTLVLNRASGETVATGDVKTTYEEQKQHSSGAMLSPAQPVHVTAQQMLQKNSTGTARFSGEVRLWQGGNIVQAPEMEFNRNDRTLEAQAEGSERVSTVFVQADKNGKTAPVEVTADHLSYRDGQRTSEFEGSVVLRSTDSRLRANRAIVLLRSQTETAKTASDPRSTAPSQVQSIDATGNVQLQQPGRRASGERLVYTAQEEKFVLTGTPGAPPSIFDAEHGQVTGVSLTFFNRDDRVLVDSSNSTSITQTRLKK